MYWRQFYAWGELKRLINKCSTFVFFDLIRKCGRLTSDYIQATADKDYRGATATTENRIPLQRLQWQSRQEQTWLHNPKYSKHTNAHYGECEKSEMIVRIKSETLEAKYQWYSKWIKSASNNSVNKMPCWYIHRKHKQSRKLWDKWCATKYKQEWIDVKKKTNFELKQQSPKHTAPTGTLEYWIVRDH